MDAAPTELQEIALHPLPDAGHFDYVFEVTEVPIVYIVGKLREPSQRGEKRLVGYEPVLEAEDYAPAAWKLFTRITLTPSDPRDAAAASAWFSVDRGLMRCLHPGDMLFVRGTDRPSLALSIVRGHQLIAAAGDLDRMSLGPAASVRASDQLEVDPCIAFSAGFADGDARRTPVEICLDGHRAVLLSGRPSVGLYDVFVRPSSRGDWACVSIERNALCPETAAHTSAQLFDLEGLAIRLPGE